MAVAPQTRSVLAMPFFEKGSLKKLLDSRNLTVKEIIRYALQFLSGLNNIHSKGVLHFDLKPENILISDSNVAVISDFGLAEYIARTGTSRVGGVTPDIMPPEFYSQSRAFGAIRHLSGGRDSLSNV